FVVNDPRRQASQWTQLPGPPAYYWRSTDSGNVYVETKRTPNGYLLFFSDRAHVHVTDGRPTSSASWHRLDGRDVSQGWLEGCFGNDNNDTRGCNKLFLHVDPHALAVSSSFFILLQDPPNNVPLLYRANKVPGQLSGGGIWMANDGGVYYTIGADP